MKDFTYIILEEGVVIPMRV